MNREEARKYISEYRILPESKFGQNFLCDEEIISSIIELTGASRGDRVLEIGSGIGALTRELSKLGCDLTAVEIDKRLAQYLKDEGFNIIASDFLKLTDYGAENFRFAVSNIPYYVMTPIITKMIVELKSCERMTFMVETAALDRIMAKPGTKQYGPLAVLCANYGKVIRRFDVPASCFIPAPHTLSSVITLERMNLPGVNGKCGSDGDDVFIINKDYERFVNRCFMNRRKKLLNNIPEARPALEQLDIGFDIRAEQLAAETIKAIYAIISKTNTEGK